jgi:hypothetical protein
MTCPKCRSHAEPTASWTISARKMTIPRVDLWACVNQDCRHEWPRDMSSLMQEVGLRPGGMGQSSYTVG